MDSQAQERGGFLIRKATMITKNEKQFEEVYKMDKKPLGTGAFGVVSKCKHKETGQERAVKTVSKEKSKNMDRFKQEITIPQQLDHPHVL